MGRKPFKVGQLVQIWIDEGEHYDARFGMVVASSHKTFTVQWDNSARNRYPHLGAQGVTLLRGDRALRAKVLGDLALVMQRQ